MVLYSDYIGRARLILNLPEVALELKRVWHPWVRQSSERVDGSYPFVAQAYHSFVLYPTALHVLYSHALDVRQHRTFHVNRADFSQTEALSSEIGLLQKLSCI